MRLKPTFIVYGLVFLLVLGTVASVSADILMPGQKSTSFSYEITNMDQYPDFVFLLFGGPLGNVQLLQSGQSFTFYKFAQPSVYAILESKYNASILQMNDTEQQLFFENNPDLVPSALVLTAVYTTVPEESPLKSSKVILTIAALNSSHFDLQKTKIIFTYTDGSTEEQAFASPDVLPSPSRSTLGLSWANSLWYIVLPGMAVCGIVYVAVKRRQKP